MPKKTPNKKNLLYFEAKSVKKLYKTMKKWQIKNKKRLLSVSIQKDGNLFCCIALSNPSEVVIVARGNSNRDKSYDEITNQYVSNGRYSLLTT